jgi:WD40 repeat protein
VYGVAFVGRDRLMSGSGDRSLRLWDRGTGECLRVLDVSPVRCVVASPDGSRFAAGGSAGRDGRVWIVDDELGLARTIRVPIASATYTRLPDRRARAIGIVADRRDTANIRAIAWHPDGRHIVTGGWDFVVKMFDTVTGKHVRSWIGHSFWVDSVAISADGERIASGSGDGHVRLWATGSTECLADFEPGPRIEGVCFAGDRVYASTDEGCVLVFP